MPRDMTAAEVNGLTKPGLYRVSAMLYLRIRRPNAKSYFMRYRRRGITRWMGLGSAAVVSLAYARAIVLKCRLQLHENIDPLAERRAVKAGRRAGAPTFSQCAADYIAAHEPGWRNQKHIQQWRSTLAYAATRLGKLSVADIGAADPVKGAIVTIDAMGCQKEIARKIVAKKADYVLALKGNQGSLSEDVELFFSEQKACPGSYAANERNSFRRH